MRRIMALYRHQEHYACTTEKAEKNVTFGMNWIPSLFYQLNIAHSVVYEFSLALAQSKYS